MSLSKRDESIIENLKIRPINHGQVFTFQVAIPPSQANNISSEKLENLKQSLVQNGSNLIPLIVRRTDAYTEDEQFEVVYGADWCLAAKELDVEKLWVWVFDLTDEQAAATRAEMENLTYATAPIPIPQPNPIIEVSQQIEPVSTLTRADIEQLLDQKLEIISAASTKQSSSSTIPSNSSINEQVQLLNQTVSKLVLVIEDLTRKLEAILPPNLRDDEETKLRRTLSKAGMKTAQINASIAAVRYWKAPDRTLTWENLKQSTKPGKHKIVGFADATYKKLQEVTEISG